MVNTNMFEFRHPKYYTELRKRNKSDQVISDGTATAPTKRAPGQGHKLQATSHKHQASTKLVNACIDQREPQAPSAKRQAASSKRQASKKHLT